MLPGKIKDKLNRILEQRENDKQNQSFVTNAANYFKERRKRASNERFFREVKKQIILRVPEIEHYLDSPESSVVLDFADKEGIVLFGRYESNDKSLRHFRGLPHTRYLCGLNPNGIWIRRFYRKIDSVKEALDHITPFEVQRAKDQGVTVFRQAGVFAVQTERDYATVSAQRCGCKWDKRTRTLYHPGENTLIPPLVVPFKCRFYRQLASRL